MSSAMTSSAPMVWLFVTLAAYAAGTFVQQRLGGSPLANPVLLAILLLVALLLASRTSYAAYFQGAQCLHLLLGPATVALAIPLANNIHHVRREFRRVALALLAGSMTSVIAGGGLVRAFGGTHELALSMAPKAATTPIAMAIASQTGGVAALTAACAIGGGILAASIGPWLLRLVRVSDWSARGLAAGVAGSGVAAAGIARLNSRAAAFAALGIGLNALTTALIVPVLVSWIVRF